MDYDTRRSTGASAAQASGLGVRLERLPFPAVLAALVVYGGLGLGLAALGGWVGLGAVFCLVGLMIAAVVAAA